MYLGILSVSDRLTVGVHSQPGVGVSIVQTGGGVVFAPVSQIEPLREALRRAALLVAADQRGDDGPICIECGRSLVEVSPTDCWADGGEPDFDRGVYLCNDCRKRSRQTGGESKP